MTKPQTDFDMPFTQMSTKERNDLDALYYTLIMDLLVEHQEQTEGCNTTLIEGLKIALEQL